MNKQRTMANYVEFQAYSDAVKACRKHYDFFSRLEDILECLNPSYKLHAALQKKHDALVADMVTGVVSEKHDKLFNE